MTAKTKTLSGKNESQNQDENRATVALPFGLTAPNHAQENEQESGKSASRVLHVNTRTESRQEMKTG
jgi:hypothetical protein